VHPVLHQVIKAIQSCLETEPSKLILETKLLTSIHQRFNIDPEKNKASLLLPITLVGAQRLEIDYQNAVPIWGYINPTLRRTLESGIKRLDDFLTLETPLPQTEIDILVRLNKGAKKSDKVTPTQLIWLIDLCASVERREDGLVWGKFEYLKGRGNQVERILFETDSPMRVADIARQINHRLVSRKQGRITERNLSHQISGDGRFVAIGRSGKWGLKAWPHIDTKSILILMEDYLISQNKSATVDEIFTYVSERRPDSVSKHSIIMYLGKEDRFVKTSRTTWGLAKWSDVTETDLWNKEQVADFVANIFKSHKTRELSYKILGSGSHKNAGPF
jgi:DNA-directed RNA polymerase delta subunit